MEELMMDLFDVWRHRESECPELSDLEGVIRRTTLKVKLDSVE